MSIMDFFKRFGKKEEFEALGESSSKSKEAAKERLHLVLMQDRANVSVDFLDMMKQEIIDVIKKYIDVDENEIDVRFTNQVNEDGTNGAPALYANIPIIGIKNEKVMNTKNYTNNKNTDNGNEKEQLDDEKLEEKSEKATKIKNVKKINEKENQKNLEENEKNKKSSKTAKKTEQNNEENVNETIAEKK